MTNRSAIVPSAAVELVNRLTESLEVPFTLTDRGGTIVASTAGRPRGQVDAYAMVVASNGIPLELGEEQLHGPDNVAGFSPAAEQAGLLPAAPGIYMPVKMSGEIAGVLFARGEPQDIRTIATTAAAAAGLTLEFTSGATDSVRQTLGPDLALRTLLRGVQTEAQRATLLVRIAGWDLLAPRVALVILPEGDPGQLTDTTVATIRELLESLAPETPIGHIGPAELVALPALPVLESQPSIQQLAEEIRRSLAEQGMPVIIGVGETHIDMPILPGLRRSYREALFSAQWAKRARATGTHSLKTLGPLAFLAPGQRSRERLALELLEPLRQVPEVLQTVRVFLESDLSLEATAKQAGLHRHTVRSHLQRARDLSGLDPRVLTDALQLKLALMLLPVQNG